MSPEQFPTNRIHHRHFAAVQEVMITRKNMYGKRSARLITPERARHWLHRMQLAGTLVEFRSIMRLVRRPFEG